MLTDSFDAIHVQSPGDLPVAPTASRKRKYFILGSTREFLKIRHQFSAQSVVPEDMAQLDQRHVPYEKTALSAFY